MQYLFLTVRIIKAISGTIIFVLGLRLILKLLGASSDVLVVNLVYDVAGFFISFLDTMFTNPQFSGRFIIDLSALFGIMLYGFLSYLLTEILESIIYRIGSK